jgi:hypothetical protein
MKPETALDGMEKEVLNVGQEVMRHLLKSQWEAVDRLLVEQYQELFPPEMVTCDGYETLKVACRLGIVHLPLGSFLEAFR